MDERDGQLSAVPCCAHWIAHNYGPLTEATSLEDLWNGAGAQEIRRRISTGNWEDMCSPDCFWRQSGRFREDRLTMLPGPPEFERNQQLNHAEIRDRKVVLASRPMAVRLIPSLRCNLRCRMCHQDHATEVRLPAAFFAGVKAVTPYVYDYQLHGGEVLISPQLSTWADPAWFAANPQLRLSLITNAAAISPANWQLLERVRLNYITVSLNAATRETYRDVSGGFDLFDEVLANVFRLRDLGGTHPRGIFEVFLSFVLMRSNYSELPAFVQLANRLGLTIRPLVVEGDRLGESVYTDPPILDDVLARVDEATSQCTGESLHNMRRIRGELQRRRAEPPGRSA